MTTLGRLVLLSSALLWPALAVAGPEEAFRDGFDDCTRARDDASTGGKSSFDCAICGAKVSCTGTNDGNFFGLDIKGCEWGSIDIGDADNGADLGALNTGYQLYCVNRSGSLTATRSVTGRQAVTLDGAFKRAGKVAREVVRGFLPAGLSGALDLSSGDVVGVAVPYGFAYGFERLGRVDVDGDVFYSHSPVLSQFGLNAKGYYQLQGTDPSATGGSTFAGATLPLQVTVTTGDKIDASPGFVLGAGGIAGYARHIDGATYGVGAAADLVRAGGFQLPTQAVVRYGVPFSGTTDFVVQPGLAVDVLAGSAIADTVQLNTLAGLTWGAWLVGAQFMYLGDGLVAGGFTVTRLDALSQSVAAGRVVTEKEAAQATKPAQVELVEALAAGDRKRVKAAADRLRPSMSPGPTADFVDRALTWAEMEPSDTTEVLRASLASAAASVLLEALGAAAPTPTAPPSEPAIALAPAPVSAAAVATANLPAVPAPASGASAGVASMSAAEEDAAVAVLDCDRVVGRPVGIGCVAAAVEVRRAVAAAQWAVAWQAWYAYQVRAGRKPVLDPAKAKREAAAFGAEAGDLEKLAGTPGGLDEAAYAAHGRVSQHPLADVWFPQLRAAIDETNDARLQAVSTAETWDELQRALPPVIAITLRADPAAPAELRHLPAAAADARKGQLDAAEATLLALTRSGHAPSAVMSQRVRVLAGRDAAQKASALAVAGRLPEAVAQLAVAERWAPGDQAVTAAAIPIRAAAAEVQSKAFAAVEAAPDPRSVAAALRSAGKALLTGAPTSAEREDAENCAALAGQIEGWPPEPLEARGAHIAEVSRRTRPPGPQVDAALRRWLLSEVVRATQADLAAGRSEDATKRVDELQRHFPEDDRFGAILRDAQSTASDRRMAQAASASHGGRWAAVEVERQRSSQLDDAARQALAALTVEAVQRGFVALLPAVRLETDDAALQWAAPRFLGDHGRWFGVTGPTYPPGLLRPQTPGVTATLRVDQVEYSLEPLPRAGAPEPIVLRVRRNPERRVCEAEAATRLEAARIAEDTVAARQRALADCITRQTVELCQAEVEAARKTAETEDAAARSAGARCDQLPAIQVERTAAPPVPTTRQGRLRVTARLVADDARLGELARVDVTESVTVPDAAATDDVLQARLATQVVDALRTRLEACPTWLTARFEQVAGTMASPEERAEWMSRALLLGRQLGEPASASERRLPVACPACIVAPEAR